MLRPPPDPLKPFQWKARILVVSAPNAADARYQDQSRALAADPDGQADRELLVIWLAGASGGDFEASAVRERLSMRPDRFELVLVGMDGTIALRRSEPVALEEVFARIDAMPMRRETLRKRAEPPAD